MPVCSQCKKKIPTASRFCNHCGAENLPLETTKNPFIHLDSPTPTDDYITSFDENFQTSASIQPDQIQELPLSNESNTNPGLPIKLLLVVAFFLAMSIGLVLYGPHIKEMTNYNYAIKQMAEHSYEDAKTSLLKSGNYKDSLLLIKECDYQIALGYMVDEEYEKAIEIFSTLNDYKGCSEQLRDAKIEQVNNLIDSKEYDKAIEMLTNMKNMKIDEWVQSALNLAYYEKGMDLYEAGNFTSARKAFENLHDEDTTAMLHKIDIYLKYQGTWVEKVPESEKNQHYVLGPPPLDKLVFSGTKVTIIHSADSEYQKVFNWDLYVNDDYLEDDLYTYKIQSNGELVVSDDDVYVLESSSAIAPTASVEPKVGMTADEARSSLWGIPGKINRTDTSYGSSEQWIYYGNRYIYIENGIVTAIQD